MLFTFFCDRSWGSTLFLCSVAKTSTALVNKYKKAASSWTPIDVHPSISRFILRCNEDISRIHYRKHHSNFTKEEHQALDHLKNNEDILIKKADKGGAVVVWKKDLYIAEGERQLNDVESYQVLDSDNTNENNRIVEEFIKEFILPLTLLNLMTNFMLKHLCCYGHKDGS